MKVFIDTRNPFTGVPLSFEIEIPGIIAMKDPKSPAICLLLLSPNEEPIMTFMDSFEELRALYEEKGIPLHIVEKEGVETSESYLTYQTHREELLN